MLAGWLAGGLAEMRCQRRGWSCDLVSSLSGRGEESADVRDRTDETVRPEDVPVRANISHLRK